MVYTVRIGWGDIDFARNIFWARYFPYVEHAIGEWLLAKGLRWQELIEERGLGMPAVRLDVRFTRPVRLQEVIEIEVGVKDVTRRGCR
ncbi:MAG: acyl-CoA thioesterase, partial [Candidatus Binatia bacterium]